MKKALLAAAIVASTGFGSPIISAAEYNIDPAHTFITFRVQHLGVSWLNGRFNDISGSFNYDANDEAASKIDMTVKTASVDSNHAERDKHLRSDDFLDTEKHPTASFKSSSFDGKTLNGDLTLHGVTKPITIDVVKVGEGKDPWGGYRAGFVGNYNLKRADFDISYNLGPAAEVVEMQFNIEGILKK
ncbi:MAG: YceI family protein [Halopseudomonas sp.]